jgi:hypothetical protein
MAWVARRRTGRRIRLAITGAVAVTALTVGTAAAMPTNGVETQAPRQTRPLHRQQPRTPSPGFLLDKGRCTTFDVPDARVGTSPLDINNRAEIVGSYSDPVDGGRRPAL